MLSHANSRAFCDSDRSRVSATVTATLFQCDTVLSVQLRAVTVWPGVRVEPVAGPIACTSATSLAYAALVSDGGPSGRN